MFSVGPIVGSLYIRPMRSCIYVVVLCELFFLWSSPHVCYWGLAF